MIVWPPRSRTIARKRTWLVPSTADRSGVSGPVGGPGPARDLRIREPQQAAVGQSRSVAGGREAADPAALRSGVSDAGAIRGILRRARMELVDVPLLALFPCSLHCRESVRCWRDFCRASDAAGMPLHVSFALCALTRGCVSILMRSASLGTTPDAVVFPSTSHLPLCEGP